MDFGCKNETGKIRSILLKHPRDAFIDQKNIDSQWRKLNYTTRPDFDEALKEYDRFVEILSDTIPEIHFLPEDENTGLDSIYVRDSVLITSRGAILCNMGKELRRGEPEAVEKHLQKLNIPVLGKIEGKGRLEGGDLILFDSETIVVGRGYRTNDEGIRQLKELTRDFISKVHVVPLPYWNGPSDCFHLMSFISPIDRNLAAVYPRLMPVPFIEWLLERNVKFVEIPDEEFDSMGCNILTIEPRKCLTLKGNPIARQRLEAEGVVILEYKGDEISMKGGGGPTCLTRPLFRTD